MYRGNNFGNGGSWQNGNGGYNQGPGAGGYNQGGYTNGGVGPGYAHNGGSVGGFSRLGNRVGAQEINNVGVRRPGMDGVGGQQQPAGGGKNFRPRIKEEGCPPCYNEADYQYMEPAMLSCVLCNKKNMWDANSFLKHILGRAHNTVVEELVKEEAEIVVEVREKMRIKADEVTGDYTRCRMCDVKVKGGEDAMNIHRRSESHQKLKRFIHPHCGLCNADFELRSEWTYHKFTAEHLTNLTMAGRVADDGVPTLEEIKKLCQSLGGTKTDDSSNKLKSDKNVVDDNAIVIEEKKLDPIMKDVDLHNEDIAGSEFIKPISGFFCKLCKNFFGPGKEVVKAHCSSKQHVDSLASFVKNKDRNSTLLIKKA